MLCTPEIHRQHRAIMTMVVMTLTACGGPERHVSEPSRSAVPALQSSTTLTYLGVAGWKLTSPGGTLLVDPYFTRTPISDDTAPLVPDATAIAAFTPEHVAAILVEHSHFDHVLDVPSIAARTSALVVGTESTANLVRASGIAELQICIAHGGDTVDLEPFHVKVVAALHSLTGQENKPIPSEVTLPLRMSEYGEGGTLQYLVTVGGKRIYFVGSANFVEENIRAMNEQVDVAVVAIGLRNKVPNYTCRLLAALHHPSIVLPNHFDAFHRPLNPGHMEPDADTQDELNTFAAEVEACAPGTRVIVPVHLEPIQL